RAGRTLPVCWAALPALSRRKSLRRRHRELGALRRRRRPALHHRLLARVEANAFLAIGVGVADHARLPAAEAVPRHRHRDRHVDADHADLDPARELARDVAVAREAGDGVAELVLVDELERRFDLGY